MKPALSKLEISALSGCEAVIKRGMATFVEVGSALLRIRDDRLYRAEFKTFTAYCSNRWQMDRSHANRLADAAKVAANLSPIGDKPQSESQLRSLTALPPQQQRQAWEFAVADSSTGKPTAKEVTVAVRKIVPIQRTDAGGDSDETCWRRGLIYRAKEAIAGAEFEDWSHFKVNSQLVNLATRAAEAWSELAAYLKKLKNEKTDKTRAA